MESVQPFTGFQAGLPSKKGYFLADAGTLGYWGILRRKELTQICRYCMQHEGKSNLRFLTTNSNNAHLKEHMWSTTILVL